MITQVLSALLVLTTVAAVIGSVYRGRTLARRVEARPDGRVRLYRNFLLRMWPLMALPVVIVGTSNRVTARDVGWAWPHGAVGYLLTAYYVLVGLLASVRVRRAMLRGRVFPQRQRIAFMMPRSARERWWAAALAGTAGVVEETIFRGSLLAVGTKVYHLPALTVMAASLVLFAASHLYQGWRGLLGSALVGFVFTAILVSGGSLLLAIVAHTAHDLISLLLIPAESAPGALRKARPSQGAGAPEAPEEGRRETMTPPSLRAATPE